jgi:hypothetical protein
MLIVLTQVISRTLQPTNVHQPATLLVSMLTAHRPTFAHVTWGTVWPITTVIQRVFLSVKMGASTDSALLRVSAPAIPAMLFFFLNERFIAQINIETYRIGTKLFRHTTNLQRWLNKYRYVCDSTKVTAVKTNTQYIKNTAGTG